VFRGYLSRVKQLHIFSIAPLKAKQKLKELKYGQLPFHITFCFDSVIAVSPSTQCCLGKHIKVGENLKSDFAFIDSACALVCKHSLYTDGKPKLSRIKM